MRCTEARVCSTDKGLSDLLVVLVAVLGLSLAFTSEREPRRHPDGLYPFAPEVTVEVEAAEGLPVSFFFSCRL
jgi:hypothetical protein